MKSILISFVLLVLVNVNYAQTCCSGGVPVSSNLGFNQGDKGLLQLTLSTDFNKLATLYQDDTSLADNLRERTTQSYILRGAYNLTNRFGIEAFLPIVRQTRNIVTNGGENDFESTFGLGDPIALLFADVITIPFQWRLAAGPQFPLGNTNELSSRGITLLEDLQPGSGAWDLVMMSSIVYQLKSRPNMSVYLNGIASITGANSNSRNGLQTYEFGDDIQFIAGANDQVLLFNRIINPGLSIRYRNAARDRINNIESTGTGGEWFFARVSVGVEFVKQSQLTISYEAPLYTRVNETQLSPDRIINFSLYKSFDFGKQNLNNIINF